MSFCRVWARQLAHTATQLAGRWVSVSSLLHIENIGIYTQYYRVETILIYLNNIHLRNKEIIINTVLVLNFTGSTSTVAIVHKTRYRGGKTVCCLIFFYLFFIFTFPFFYYRRLLLLLLLLLLLFIRFNAVCGDSMALSKPTNGMV